MPNENPEPPKDRPPVDHIKMMLESGDPELQAAAHDVIDQRELKNMDVFSGEALAGTPVEQATRDGLITVAHDLTEHSPRQTRADNSGTGTVYSRSVPLEGGDGELIVTTDGVNREAWPNAVSLRSASREEPDPLQPDLEWTTTQRMLVRPDGETWIEKTRNRWDESTHRDVHQSAVRPAYEEDVTAALTQLRALRGEGIDQELMQMLEQEAPAPPPSEPPSAAPGQ